MFHKYALIINCVFLGFCVFSYYSPFIMQIIYSSLPPFVEWHLSYLFLISQCLIFFCLVSVVFVIISCHFTTVRIGRPPVDSLTIAYKYGYSDSVSTSAVQSSYELFPSYDKVQICYEKKSGPFGLAHGVVIQNQLTEETRATLINRGFSILQTKPISNAIYISSPAVPWLSYFGVWLTLVVVYPKLYKYSKTHKLSAYPVLELYRRFSITLIAPLSQQDVFVVPEAEGFMNRSMRHVNADSSMTERSLSTTYHSARVKLSETDVTTTLLTPRHSLSLSPVESLENIKLSCRLSLSPLNNGYTAKIILKHHLTPNENDNVAKPIPVRTSTPVASNGNTCGEE